MSWSHTLNICFFFFSWSSPSHLTISITPHEHHHSHHSTTILHQHYYWHAIFPLTKSKAAFVYFLYSLSIHQLYTLAISKVSSILFVYSNQMIPLTHFGVYTFCILHDHHLYKKYTNLCETPWPFQMMYTFCILHGLGHTKSIHSLKMIQLWWIWSIKKVYTNKIFELQQF